MIEAKCLEKSVQTKNGKIFYYLSVITSSKPTIVFLHGLTANHTQCSEIIKLLEKDGYRCLVPDLRGHGHSDKTKKQSLYKVSVFSEDLLQILNQEKLDQIILAGYSFGGTIALDFSIKHSDRVSRLILISSNYMSPVKHWRIPFLLPLGKALLSFMAVILLWQKRKVYYYYRHNESLTYWRATLLGFFTMPISIDLWMLREIISLDFEESLQKIKAKTLIIQSKDDPFVSRAEILTMNSKIPDSEVAVATQNSHFIATRTQEETAKFILNFLRTKPEIDNKQNEPLSGK